MLLIAWVQVSVQGEDKLLKTCLCVHVSPVGMQKVGKDVGRREVSEVGIGVCETKSAAGSCAVIVHR